MASQYKIVRGEAPAGLDDWVTVRFRGRALIHIESEEEAESWIADVERELAPRRVRRRQGDVRQLLARVVAVVDLAGFSRPSARALLGETRRVGRDAMRNRAA